MLYFVIDAPLCWCAVALWEFSMFLWLSFGQLRFSCFGGDLLQSIFSRALFCIMSSTAITTPHFSWLDVKRFGRWPWCITAGCIMFHKMSVFSLLCDSHLSARKSFLHLFHGLRLAGLGWAVCLRTCNHTACTAAGVMPEMRPAAARVGGRCWVSFWRTSWLNPPIMA